MPLVAIQFFANRREYEEEVATLDALPRSLRTFTPTVLETVANADNSITCPFGTPVVPFIVMEKGESLRDRLSIVDIPVFGVGQVACLLCSGSHAGYAQHSQRALMFNIHGL